MRRSKTGRKPRFFHGTALASAMFAMAMTSLMARAQPYPNKPIRLIVQSPAGGTADFIARLIAQRLAERLGQTVVADNRAGAAGTVSAEITAQATPDGYTLLLASVSLMAINVTLRAGKISYDPVKDFTHITLTGTVPLALSVQPAYPAKTLKEFIALAKAKPGSINYGSAGVGSSNHITGEMLKTDSGIDMAHVPFQGGAPAMAALLANQLQLYIGTVPTLTAMVRAGRLRALAVSTLKRSAALPDVPTIAEAGLPGFDSSSWFCVVGPAGVPRAIVTRLNSEIVAILQSADARERLTAAGVNVETTTPEGLRAYVQSEMVKMGRVVKASGAKVE
jgi:tripartite-type tricarboxylate transporter receptor subunit TctC